MDTAAQAASAQTKAAVNPDRDDLHQFNSAEKLPSNIEIADMVLQNDKHTSASKCSIRNSYFYSEIRGWQK